MPAPVPVLPCQPKTSASGADGSYRAGTETVYERVTPPTMMVPPRTPEACASPQPAEPATDAATAAAIGCSDGPVPPQAAASTAKAMQVDLAMRDLLAGQGASAVPGGAAVESRACARRRPGVPWVIAGDVARARLHVLLTDPGT